MNRITSMLLSLILIGGFSYATPQSEEYRGAEFSVDELKFTLDWDDKQFDWSQNDCLDLGMGDPVPPECKGIRVNLDDEENRNRPPVTNQIPASQSSGQ